MFVLFKSALSSRQLFINPSFVRCVVDGDQIGQVKICFDDQNSVTVLGTTTEVADELTGLSE
jgi:hypothetical protein